MMIWFCEVVVTACRIRELPTVLSQSCEEMFVFCCKFESCTFSLTCYCIYPCIIWTLSLIVKSWTILNKASSQSVTTPAAAASFSLKDNLFTIDTGSALYIVPWTFKHTVFATGFTFTLCTWSHSEALVLFTSRCVNMQDTACFM